MEDFVELVDFHLKLTFLVFSRKYIFSIYLSIVELRNFTKTSSLFLANSDVQNTTKSIHANVSAFLILHCLM